MKIRNVNVEDLETLACLIARNFDEVIARYHSRVVVEKFKSHNTSDHLRNQMNWKAIYVVEDNGEIIATGALANFGNASEPKYSISNFYVRPENHRQGVGRLLFQHLRQLAVEKGAERLHVPSTRNGVSFYESMGFQVDTVQEDLEDEITWMSMTL